MEAVSVNAAQSPRGIKPPSTISWMGQRGGWRHGGLSTHMVDTTGDGTVAAAPPHETLEELGLESLDLKGLAGGAAQVRS